jgi:RecA/RadA recombinase
LRYRTGIPLLDDSLGGGVLPGVCHIWGEPDSGVTSLALCIAREVCLQGKLGAFIDAQYSSTGTFIKDHIPCGVYVVPYSGEAALEASHVAAMNGASVVIVDTLDACVPTSEMNSDVGKRDAFAQRRLLHHFVLSSMVDFKDSSTLLIITSQTRLNESYFRPGPSQSPPAYTTSQIHIETKNTREKYGKKYLSDVDITVLHNGDHYTKKVLKSRLWPATGFRRGYDLITKLLKSGCIERRGSYWKSKCGESLGPGLEAAVAQAETRYEKLLNIAYGITR